VRPGATARRRVERIVVGAEGGVERRTRDDHLAVEEPLEIRLEEAGGEAVRVAVTMRTPGADFELAAGFLHAEGAVRSASEIAGIRYCTEGAQRYNVVSVSLAPGVRIDPALLSRNFYATSSCGVCGKASIEAALGPAPPPVGAGPALAPGRLLALPARLREAQRLFDRTGGLHAAAHFTAEGELVRLREDVGRHNALDKVLGAALLAGELPLGGAVVLVSGRVGFELVQKAARAGVGVLAGVSAPSSLAVELAERSGMTLAGFVRPPGFNVYTGGGRIAASGEGASG
jgi:FdhD protein